MDDTNSTALLPTALLGSSQLIRPEADDDHGAHTRLQHSVAQLYSCGFAGPSVEVCSCHVCVVQHTANTMVTSAFEVLITSVCVYTTTLQTN